MNLPQCLTVATYCSMLVLFFAPTLGRMQRKYKWKSDYVGTTMILFGVVCAVVLIGASIVANPAMWCRP